MPYWVGVQRVATSAPPGLRFDAESAKEMIDVKHINKVLPLRETTPLSALVKGCWSFDPGVVTEFDSLSGINRAKASIE